MTKEVEHTQPEAVVGAGGVKHVKYDLLIRR